jgi:hypothetical protein
LEAIVDETVGKVGVLSLFVGNGVGDGVVNGAMAELFDNRG